MWSETKHGLYKQFVFADFHHAWVFMEQASTLFNYSGYYPRWQNEANVVEMWLPTVTIDAEDSSQKGQNLSKELDRLAEQFDENKMEVTDGKNTTKITEVQLYADGGSRGNPGPSASGFVVLDMAGKVLHKEGVYLGITTNNQAEYQALKLGLEYCLNTFGVRKVWVRMDSLLVINQMKDIFKVRNRDLWPVHDSIKNMLGGFKFISFEHIPRELNKLADTEVNKCLDAEQGLTT